MMVIEYSVRISLTLYKAIAILEGTEPAFTNRKNKYQIN